MAYITPVNGDAQPVFALDTRNGPIPAATQTTGSPVQPAGPKLDFFSFTSNANLALQSGVQEYVSNVLQALQQTCTVAMYQVDTTQISVAVYPTGAFANTAVALAAANVTYTGIQLNSCADVGFKLATS